MSKRTDMKTAPRFMKQVFMGSSVQLTEHDAVIKRRIYKHQVTTGHEVKLLFDLCAEYSQEKIGLGLIGIQFMRPCEYGDLRWTGFKLNEKKTLIEEMTHSVYKPTNQMKKKGKNYYYKETRKPFYSSWLSNQVINYARHIPQYEGNRVLSWTSGDMINKRFMQWREQAQNGELGEEYNFLLDRVNEVVYGTASLQYRVNVYALRRFALSFHYWVTYKQDIMKLAEVSGHTRADTLLRSYIKPKEAIGLTQKDIDNEITIDEFIHVIGKKQMLIPEFFPEWRKRMLPVGQRQLNDYPHTIIQSKNTISLKSSS